MADNLPSQNKGLATLWRRRPLLTSAFGIAVVLTTIFAFKALVHLSYWTEHRLQPVASWMSPSYVARVWMLDEEEVLEAIGVTDATQRGLPITRIAIMQGKSSHEIVTELREIIANQHGDPPA